MDHLDNESKPVARSFLQVSVVPTVSYHKLTILPKRLYCFSYRKVNAIPPKSSLETLIALPLSDFTVDPCNDEAY